MKEQPNRMEKFSVERGGKKKRKAAGAEAKLPCPVAGCDGKTRVLQTRGPVQSGALPRKWIVRRQRQCLKCGYKRWSDESYWDSGDESETGK